ncbi:serine/arginine repetitive matrix protein 3-like [Symphalangus syndactylus]|uniref:serine/arginine repetitive matrix protein 3-like n=1 Tax=Symphalangus syndactylus TaxID=9590 RepID=UPI002441CDBE|nr:serine/arginine repetitive matrix protein 3-like [Symphalangus syndactylus]
MVDEKRQKQNGKLFEGQSWPEYTLITRKTPRRRRTLGGWRRERAAGRARPRPRPRGSDRRTPAAPSRPRTLTLARTRSSGPAMFREAAAAQPRQPRRRGQARNRAPPSSFPVATPPSPVRTRGKAGAGGFTPGTSASAWPSLSLSSSPLQPPVTPPEPGLKTSPVSVRLSPQPPRSQDSVAPQLAATRARDTRGHVTTAGTGRAA